MSDKAIYSVDTVETITDNDKIYVNTGDNIKQIKRSDLFIDINSNLSQLELSDIAGGKNLLKESTFYITKESKRITDYDMPVGTYTISFYSNVDGVVDFYGLQNNSIIGGGGCTIKPSGRSTKTFTVKTPSKLMCYSNVSTTITDIQIEEGETATDYEPFIPSVKMLAEEVSEQNDSLSVIGKCKNQLNPTLQTTTVRGVTITNNGDGTYTLNGTSTDTIYLLLSSQTFDLSKTYKIVGCPEGGDGKYSIYDDKNRITGTGDKGNGGNPYIPSVNPKLYISIQANVELNNLVFKPMFTTNLNATYDDFVPYTGNGETLTADVAELKNDLEIIDQVVVENGITFTFSKTGNVKQIIWEGALINTVNAWENLVTIPVEFRPRKNNFYFNDSYNSYKYYCNKTAIQPTLDATPGTYAGHITYI